MPEYKIHFRHGLSLARSTSATATAESRCARALTKSRWPDGYVYPRHAARKRTHVSSRTIAGDWQGSTCRSQSTVYFGTWFHASKLPLTLFY